MSFMSTMSSQRGMYDRNIFHNTPVTRKAQRQEGSGLRNAWPRRPPSTQTLSPPPRYTEIEPILREETPPAVAIRPAMHTESENIPPEETLPAATYSEKPVQVFWQSRNGVIIIFLIVLVLGAVIGGAIGGTVGKSPNKAVITVTLTTSSSMLPAPSQAGIASAPGPSSAIITANFLSSTIVETLSSPFSVATIPTAAMSGNS